MVCCNIDDSELPENKQISSYMEKSKIVEINGRKIGIIGYLTTKTPVTISLPHLQSRYILLITFEPLQTHSNI